MKSSCLSLRAWTVLAATTLAVAAHAQPQSAADAQAHAAQLEQRAQARELEHQAIAQKRESIEAQKAESEKACWQRFAVEGCLRDVRTHAREQDNLLHRREIELNNEARQEKAAERLRAIAQKKNEKQAAAPMQPSVRGAKPAPQAPAAAKTPADIAASESQRASAAQERAAQQAARLAQQQADQAERVQTEAQRSAAAKQSLHDKQQAAQAHRASKADAIAQRKGAPLPIPEGLSKP